MKQYLYEYFSSTSGGLSLTDVVINFIAAAIIAVLIFISYRISHAGTLYSRKFNVSLVMLVMVTTLVMNVIGNNIALSLGMVGALSIVRFRTAIKDPRDTAYIFWAIAVGICCGVSDYLIAGIGSFLIFMIMAIFGYARETERVLIIIRGASLAEGNISNTVDSMFKGKARVRVTNIDLENKQMETIYEVTSTQLEKAQSNGTVAERMQQLEGITGIDIVRQEDEVNQ